MSKHQSGDKWFKSSRK